MRTARLLGSRHTRLGAIEGVAIGAAALAISRGGAAKPYEHVEPNEDCAGLGVGAGGVLLCVADGHWGAHGAEAATMQILDEAAPRWCGGRPREAVAEALYHELQRANEAVGSAASRHALPLAPTTLAFAVVRPAEQRLAWAAVGDSHLFRVDAQGATDLGCQALGRERPRFLGPPEESWHREDTALGTAPLGNARALVLVTDGLSEAGIGVADPAGAVAAAVDEARAVEAPRRAQWLARRVVETALDAHRRGRGGDNVAVAALWLGGDD